MATFPAATGHPGGLLSLDFTDRKVIFLIFLVLVAGAVLALSNLRDTRVGRAFFAIRGSEVAAASLGVHVTRYKLYAFLLSAAGPGIVGGLAARDQSYIEPISVFPLIMTITMIVMPRRCISATCFSGTARPATKMVTPSS